MHQSHNDLPPERPSKSERKREILALQKIGEALVELAETQFNQIPLEPFLSEAIVTARNIKSREARRRQLQYIGRLMCEVDIQPIQAALDKIKHKDQKIKTQLHQVERWRDELISIGDAKLQEFVEKFPQADRQHIRQLIRKSQQDRLKNKNSGAETELFRYIREIVNT